MDFGLGLVLSFTDNASSGIQNAVNSLNQLTETASNASSSLTGMAQLGAFSVVTNQLGSSFVSAGQSILSTFTQIIGKVNETGQTLMYAENQLDKLYEGSSRTGKDVLGDISQYAKQSIFEFEDLIPVVTMLKANGIEAFDMIASSTGNANQTLMDYAADLAAFNPQMRNAYGTGIKAAMGALNEYIAEGNAMSLKRGASLDITSILGEDKGATIEERSRQVADLMEKLNMVGMTAQLAETPMVKLSNMSDTLFQFLGMIAQSGVYDKFNDIIGVFADFINNIPSDELQAVANSIGSALADLLKPIEWLAEKIVTLARGFKDLVSNNPEIAKFVILGTALTGVLLLLSGIALKVASSIGMLTIGLNSFGGSFSTITTLLKGGAMKILGTLLPLTATIGLVYLAWKSDFGGIRTLLTQFISNIRGSFDTARQALNMNVNDMMITVNNLQNTGDFWSNITVGLIKIGTLWQALSDAWNDYTLSEDVYLKCKELGILPLVEAILDLKWRFDHFKEGFMEGWNTIGNFVKGIVTSISDTFKGTFIETAIDGITRFFQALSNNDPEQWRKVGVVIGEIAAVILPLATAMKMFNRVTSLGGIIPRIFGNRGGSGGSGGGSSSSGGFFSSPSKALKTMGSIVVILGGVTLMVEALGALSNNPYFVEFLDKGTKTLTKLASSILSVAAVAGVMSVLVASVTKMGVSPKSAVKGIADIAIMIGGIDLIVTAVGALNEIPYMSDFLGTGITTLNSLSTALMSIAKISVVMGAVSLIFSKLRISPKEAALGIANVAIIIGGLDLLITAVGALNNIPYFSQFLSDGVGVMSTLMSVLRSMFSVEILGTIALIALFGAVPVSMAALGIANLAIVLGGVTLLIEAFGALSKIPGFNDFLSSGGDTLALLFEQIGKAVGSVIGGVAEGITEALPGIGENLAEFGTNIQPFFTAISGAPLGEVADFSSALGTFMLKMAAEEVLSFITGGVDLPALGQQLSEFGTSVRPFFDSVASISEDGLSKAPRVIEAISNIGGYGIKTGGLAQLFTGETNLVVIGEQLAEFAPNGAIFFNAVASYSESGLEKAPKVFEALSGLGDYDFKTGGLAQLFTGETNLSEIGKQLAEFAPNGTTFFNTVAGYSESGLEKAPKVFKALAGIGDYDFKTGGLAQLFTGGTDLGEIGKQLTEFGEEGQKFFEIAAGISDAGLTKGQAMVDAVGQLGAFKTGGLVELFTGSLDLPDIGEQLSDFGEEAKNFFDIATNISSTGISNAGRIFSVLSVLGGTDFRSGGLVQLFTGNISLSSIGSELSNFATNAKTFFDTAASLDTAGFSNASRMFYSLKSASDVVDFAVKSNGSLSDFGEELVSFVNNVEIFVTKAGQLGDMSGIGTLTEALQTLSDKFSSVEGGISKGASSIITSLSDMSDKSKETSKSYVSDMETMISTQTTSYSQMVTATSNTFQTLYTTIDTQMQSAVSAVQSAVNAMKSTMNFQWSLPHLKVPHVNVSGGFNLEPPSAPKFSVDWYAEGGVFNKPSVIGVGEAGTEAVMPLENNTGWISELAFMISKQIMGVESRQFIPTDSAAVSNNTSTVSEDRYMTSNVTNNNTKTGDTDNSVNFAEGAIQINCQNASEEEALRMAKVIMEYIKRQKELDKMLAYG